MHIDKVIKKFEKRFNGKKPERSGNGRKWGFVYEDRIATFLVDNEGDARNWHIRRLNDMPDLMTDYFPGTFYDNATQMINALKPPPHKYPKGALVRVKGTRRAMRWGLAGRTGLVIDHTKRGYNILWSDTSKMSVWYYERDLELAS